MLLCSKKYGYGSPALHWQVYIPHTHTFFTSISLFFLVFPWVGVGKVLDLNGFDYSTRRDTTGPILSHDQTSKMF